MWWLGLNRCPDGKLAYLFVRWLNCLCQYCLLPYPNCSNGNYMTLCIVNFNEWSPSTKDVGVYFCNHSEHFNQIHILITWEILLKEMKMFRTSVLGILSIIPLLYCTFEWYSYKPLSWMLKEPVLLSFLHRGR
jgi:hypothetical protein